MYDQFKGKQFLDFMRDRVGPNWCVAARTTARLQAKYGTVVTPKRYRDLESEFERQYGGPL